LMLSLPMSILAWSISLFPKVLHTFGADVPGPSTSQLMYRPASADGGTDIRSKKDLYCARFACRSAVKRCVPRQSAIQANSPFRAHSLACLAFGPCKQIPSFTMSISKTPALCKAAKLVS